MKKISTPASGFWSRMLGPWPAEPGELVHLAREADGRTANLARSAADPQSREGLLLAGEVFCYRMALAQSEPLTDLDCLVLTFQCRQAVRVLRGLPLDESHDAHRAYWLGELDASLASMQRLFETTAGYSIDDLGFTLQGGTSVN